ncbi:hypothetical protein PTNB73_06075 [Pyrenophora teres f. teres]|nr:hypothetical protein PTNB85_07982 [Pyrenophora teres f. teres]KAE8829956.1 hypothetical protein HRS9139_06580 [Pyrenophora teres f. teres]KAE8841705.1 hypothetical protein HRS9122_05831 [Pyrenophora teres f. teres]KAE8865187.1 hypothetical protein PTNB73_06075 [Pyrenophora teres f. teres]
MWQSKESFYPLMEEDTDDDNSRALVNRHTYEEDQLHSSHTEEDLDEAYTIILEEEDDTCAQAELECDHELAARIERDINGYDEDLKEAYFSFLESRTRDMAARRTLLRHEEAFKSILEEEEAVRVQAEDEMIRNVDLIVEREFDENCDLFQVFDREYDEGVEICSEWYDDVTSLPTIDDDYFEARIKFESAELSNSRFQSQLCSQCRAVRWSAFARPMTLNEPHIVYKTRGSPLTLQKSKCELCRLLGRIGYRRMSSIDSHDGKMEFEISTCNFHRSETNVLVLSLGNNLEQALITFHLTSDNKVWIPRISHPEAVDYNALKARLDLCCRSHTATCRPGPGIKLLNFKVIDCYSRKIVQAPAGLTVEDSLRVTKNMGFRYLWVDQCCIDQGNESEKQGLVRHMDEIYSKAQLTIIAAAGKDPYHGLPGVGSRPRRVQHGARIGNIRLMPIMCPGQDFEKSSWWTRAWTYQEGVLSKRKLVFTDYQVFYVCNRMQSAENLNVHVGSAAYDSTRRAFGPDIFGEMLFADGNQSYVSYLRDISARSLTCPSDALNTCLGILRATNTKHLWGIPIATEPASREPTIALCWHHDVMTKRRNIFPSWSWTDWEKGANFQDSVVKYPFVTVSIGRDQHCWQTLYEYIISDQAAECAGRENAPRLLKLTGLTLDSALLSSQWPDIADFGTGAAIQQDDRPRPRFSLSIDGMSVLSILYMDEEMSAEQLCDVIAFGVQTGRESCRISSLLLKPRGEFYVRVGMIALTCDNTHCKKICGTAGFWQQAAQQRTVVVE